MIQGHVVLQQGNLFDGAKDMIVIPCNTRGGVTQFVREALIHHNVNLEVRSQRLGEVHFQQLGTASHVAQFAALAASVQQETSFSSPEALKKIGASLGSFAVSTPTVRLISAPLLGTGYGGIPPEFSVVSLKSGFLQTAPPQATLRLNVIDPSAYDMVARLEGSAAVQTTRIKRVFISYTHSSEEHGKWVLELATQLRNSGIESRLDVWHLRPGMDVPQWMCTELSLADKVIILSDEAYAERADGRPGGVGWETMVIQGDIANLPPNTTKYIVVVRSDNFDNAMPLYLKTKFALHAPTSCNMSSLVSKIATEVNERFDIPEVSAPTIKLA